MMPIVLAIMKAVPSQHFTCIDLDFGTTLIETADFLSLLPMFAKHRDFRSISISVSLRDPIVAESLEPLLALRNLETLTIDIRGGFEIENADLSRMADSWPNLREIDFGRRSYLGRSTITVTGLLPLLSECPKLQKIYLDIDAASPLPPLGEDFPVNEEVQTLAVGVSRIEKADDIVRFILTTMPNVKDIQHAWTWSWRAQIRPEEQAEYTRRWGYVGGEVRRAHQVE